MKKHVLAFLLMAICLAQAALAANVALNKTTKQSGTSSGGVSSRAVDGNTDGNWNNGSVTHTTWNSSAWWEVDLGASYTLTEIKIYNRTDCCGTRLNNAAVLVSTSAFPERALTPTEITTYRKGTIGTAQAINTFSLSGTSGRYVRIQLVGGEYLSLAEVQVTDNSATGNPLIVDDDKAQCPTAGSTTIAAAIAAASAGSTITVCPGTYNETVTVNKSGLTIKGSTGNAADVKLTNFNTALTLTAASLTLKDMTVESTGNTGGMGIQTTASSTGPHVFENLIVSARARAIDIQAAVNADSFKSVAATSVTDSAIYFAWNATGGHVLEGVTAIGQTWGIYADHGFASLTNVIAEGKTNAAIRMGNSHATTFSNVTATATGVNGGAHGIQISNTDNISNAYTFTDIKVTAKDYGIDIARSGKVTMSNVQASSANATGIYLEWSADGGHVLDGVTASGKDYGIYIDRGVTSMSQVTASAAVSAAISLGNRYSATLNNVTATSTTGVNGNAHGISIKNSDSTSVGFTFTDIKTTAKNNGIVIERSGKVTMTRIEATSTADCAIYLKWNADGGHVLQDITATGSVCGISGAQGATSLKNVTAKSLATSGNNAAIYLGSKYATTFDTVTASSPSYIGIWLVDSGSVNNTLSFTGIKVTSKKHGISIARSGRVTMNDITVNSSEGSGIYFEWNADGLHELRNLDLTTGDTALYAAQGLVTVEDFKITSAWKSGIDLRSKYNTTIQRGEITLQSDPYGSARGIHYRYDQDKSLTVQDITVKAAGHQAGVQIDRSSSAIVQRVCISGTGNGAIMTAWDAGNVTIRDSQLSSSGDNGGAMIDSNPNRKAIITNNAFLKSAPRRAYSNSTLHSFSRNYWQGISGGTVYSEGNIRDSATLNSNPVTSCYSATPTLPIAEWRLDEPQWNGMANEMKDSGPNGLHGRTISDRGVFTIPGTTGKLCGAPGWSGNDGTKNGLLVPDNSLLDTQKISLMAWVYPTRRDGWDYIIKKYGAYKLVMNASGNLVIELGYGSDDNTYRETATGITLPLNTWSLVAATYDGRFTKSYVFNNSGTLLSKHEKDWGSEALLRNSPHGFQIGPYSGWGTADQFDGRVDEVKVFGQALSEAQITTIATNEATGKNWDGSTRVCASSPISCSYPVHAGISLNVGQESEINNHDITGSGNAINPDTGVRSTVSQTLGALSPASFPSYSGGSDYNGSASALVPGTTYNSVTLTGGTAPSGTYYIHTLTIKNDITFGGGTFYVKTMTVEEEESLTFTAATQFRIGTGFNAGKEVRMRSGSGDSYTHNPWAQFYLYNGADWQADKELRFDGIVVANSTDSNITVDKELTMTGAFITGGTVTLGKEADITVNSAVTSALASSGVCGESPPPTPTPVEPAGFNCVEVGGNASSGHLYTKVVSTAFNFDIVALKADGSVETSYATDTNKTPTVELVEGSGSTACASRTVLATWSTQTFTAAHAGRLTSSAASLDNAYANLRCRVREGTVTGCSSDNFSIRPAGFTATASANADNNGANATATPVIKTGTGFTLTASASPGYTGTPTLDTSKAQAHSGAVQTGSLSGGFPAANAATGVASGTGLTYSEVGYFRLAANGITDTTFTAVDSANGDCTSDYSNSQVNGKFGCYFGNAAATPYFGRFVPDHFAVAQGTLTPGNGSFTYYGQDFSTGFSLYAQNSTNATTQNYTGGFARLALNNWAGLSFTAVDTSNAAVPLSTGTSPPSGTWNNGTASVTASHKTTRATSGTPNAEASLTVRTQAADGDGTTLASPTAIHATAALHRFGRLRLANAYGSELTPLPMSLTAQYWNGIGFVTNTLDSSTALTTPAFTFYGQTASNQLASGETTATLNGTQPSGVLVAGNGGLRLSAPGEGNYGYVDLTVTAPAWLQYNWDGVDQGGDGNTFDDPPRARAAFGKRNNASKVIIRREIY